MSSLVWFRRDLRLHDHHALAAATHESKDVHLCFIFDETILNKLPNKSDKRLTFIIQSLQEMEKELNKTDKSIHILFGNPESEIPKLCKKLKTKTLYLNRDYEPSAKKRDQSIAKALKDKVNVKTYKDHVYFESDEVLTQKGTHYTVFTPYKNRWLESFNYEAFSQFKVDRKSISKFANKSSILNKDWHKAIGFKEDPSLYKGGATAAKKLLKKFVSKIDNYHELRDFPNIDGTSMLSPYIRHGNISVRDCIFFANSFESRGAEIWLSEIIWREFYQAILDQFPHVVNGSFKKQYDKIKWTNNKKHFNAWKKGETGFPLVDAAMRYFAETGIMHNRLRMVVSNFLIKILQVDWRWGEKYFAEKLLDFDLAANNGGWQWSSSSGCDGQPYFRIFNPYTQSEKFDKDGEFIKQHCPELIKITTKKIHDPSQLTLDEQASFNCVLGKDYPHPIVDYKEMREDTLNRLYNPVK